MNQSIGFISGGLFLTFFGAFWAVPALSQFHSAWDSIMFGITALVILGLLAACLRLWHVAQRTVELPDLPGDTEDPNLFKRFGIVVALETIFIIVASITLGRANHSEYIAPVVGIIVGLHFIPLAVLFRLPIYYMTATVFVLLSVIAIIASLAGVTLGAPENWSIVVRVVNALILWFTAGYVLASRFRSLRVHTQRPFAKPQGDRL